MVTKRKKARPKRRRKAASPPEPTRVVYLFGAGATQAEVSYDGPGNVSVLMTDTDLGEGVSTGILSKLGTEGEAFKADKGTDIEKVISLLTASGIDEHLALAQKMRKLYFE